MPCLYAIYIICIIGTFHRVSVDAALLKIYCGSLTNFISTELEQPLPLLNSSSCYKSSRPSVIYAFGFTQSAGGDDTAAIVSAYLNTNRYNVFLIDWEKEAASIVPITPLGYILYAVPNAAIVGKKAGRALITMAQNQFDLTRVHVIGHSLGAHLVGYCGKEVQKYNTILPHITGLDPAGPLFAGIASLHGLDARSASFVDILHTNPGYLGNDELLGSVDIWCNYINGSQPGCTEKSGLLDTITNTASSCAHARAWLYYAEAIANPLAFQARKAESYERWRAEMATSASVIINVGETIDKSARGKYYLSTDATAPYGRGERGVNP